MFLQIQLEIGAKSLPGSQNCTNCYWLAPVSPATNACNRQKSKRQQTNASKSDWICQNIPTGTTLNSTTSAHGHPPHPYAFDTQPPCNHRHSALWLTYRSAIAWPSIMQDSRQRKSASQEMGLIQYLIQSISVQTLPSPQAVLRTHSSRQPTLRQARTWVASGY